MATSVTLDHIKLRFSKAAGAAAAANITVTGIKTTDHLLGIIHIEDLAVTSGDVVKGELLAEASITAANTIQLSTTNTTGDTLIVVWNQAD